MVLLDCKGEGPSNLRGLTTKWIKWRRGRITTEMTGLYTGARGSVTLGVIRTDLVESHTRPVGMDGGGVREEGWSRGNSRVIDK